jgi:hypothetical protein
VAPLPPAIAIPVVASVAINGERSALVGQFVKTCQETMRLLRCFSWRLVGLSFRGTVDCWNGIDRLE